MHFRSACLPFRSGALRCDGPIPNGGGSWGRGRCDGGWFRSLVGELRVPAAGGGVPAAGGGVPESSQGEDERQDENEKNREDKPPDTQDQSRPVDGLRPVGCDRGAKKDDR